MARTFKNLFPVLACVIIFAIISGISMLRLAELNKISGGPAVLDMRLSYTGNGVETLFHKLGQSGRSSYTEFLFFDYLFIILLACIQALLIGWFCLRLQFHRRWRKLKILAYARGVFDALENLFILILLFHYPGVTRSIAAVANLMTILKWIATVAVFAVLLGLAIILALKSFFHKEEK